MSSTAAEPTTAQEQNTRDPQHPTKEPFTSPGESSNVNNCNCCGIFLVPVAALGGLIQTIIRKLTFSKV